MRNSASILGWIIGKRYLKIRPDEKIEKEREIQDLCCDELYYKEEELDSLPSELRELLDCNVDLCSIRSPVISPNGITYEKNSIVEWLKRKNLCPLTKQELKVGDLRFNRNLYNMINFLILRDRYNRTNQCHPIEFKEILE